MRIKIFTLFLCSLLVASVTAQQPTATIKKVPDESPVPVLDGEIDDIWGISEAFPIDRLHQAEVPTIGNSTWQGVWTDRAGEYGVYLLFIVEDDNYWPHYLSGGADSWMFDKIEIYFDCAFKLDDGGGAGDGDATGHHQIAPEFAEGKIDGTMQDGNDASDADPVWYSHLVNNPDYIAEYFIPIEYLNDESGSPTNLNKPIGFDVTIIDQDEGVTTTRHRGTWANEGVLDESWNNMDDVGILTFEGAEDPEWITEITITDGAISENNGVLMLEATVLPEDYTENYTWSLVNFAAGTNGKASLDAKKGMLTGILDGTVSVIAMAATGFVSDTIDVVITNQIVSLGDINLIRNGFFDDVDENNVPDEWEGGGSDDGDAYVNDEGVSVHNPALGGTAPWSYGFNQRNFGCNGTTDYIFSFVAWAESPRPMMVAFEDPSNNYNRYGYSESGWELTPSHYWWNSGPGTDPPQDWTGNSMWEMDLTTEPFKFEIEMDFAGMDPPTGEPTTEVMQFHLGLSDTIVYIDSVVLIDPADLALLTDYIPVDEITVTGADGATTVETGGGTLQMSAAILPEDADYKDVKWNVILGTGVAKIDENGLLSGDTAGTVTVVASAVDDSKKVGELVIDVSWPEGISESYVSPLKIYPNPAVNELTVELGNENAMISIFNSLGQLMDEVLVSGAEYRFDVSSYSSGIYYVKSGNSVAKFIK